MASLRVALRPRGLAHRDGQRQHDDREYEDRDQDSRLTLVSCGP
jgi:hypothetical protein